MFLHEKTFYYYKYLFNFNYYLFLSPYRVKCVDKSQSYVIMGGGIHQLICIIIHTILILASITMLLGAFNGEEEEVLIKLNPLRLFNLARSAGFPGYVLTFVSCIWFQKSHFLHIVQLVPYPSKTCSVEIMKICMIVTIACLAGILITPLYMLGEDVFDNCKLWPAPGNDTDPDPDWDWDVNCFYAYSGRVYHNLFLRPNSAPLTPEELTPTAISLTIIYGVLNIYQLILIHMTDTFALIGALAIHSIGKNLATILTKDVKTEMSTVTLMKYYGEVNELIQQINYGTGAMVVCMFLVTLPYFVENLMVLFEEDDWALKIRFFYYFIHYFSIMVIAAEANRHLNELKNWVLRKICMEKSQQNRNLLYVSGHFESPLIGEIEQFENQNNQWKLAIIYLETSTHNVGLKGCHFFTITFGFLGSIVSILLTYFIVMVQFKAPFNAKSSFRKPGTISGGTFVNPEMT